MSSGQNRKAQDFIPEWKSLYFERNVFTCWCMQWNAFEQWCVHLLMHALKCLWTVMRSLTDVVTEVSLICDAFTCRMCWAACEWCCEVNKLQSQWLWLDWTEGNDSNQKSVSRVPFYVIKLSCGQQIWLNWLPRIIPYSVKQTLWRKRKKSTFCSRFLQSHDSVPFDRFNTSTSTHTLHYTDLF